MKIKSLPNFWMLFALVLLLLPAFLPLLNSSALPCTHDNALHYYRMTAMRDAFRQGWSFSRWVPNLALGYGYPFFNFREPLPYLLGAGLYALGVPLPLLLGVLYALSAIAAAWGAFFLVRDLFGPRAAFISALAYSLGPYLLLDALRRGNLPESVALALLPWMLFSFRRLILGRGRAYFLLSVSLLVALFLSHNISSLLFAPFLGCYVLLLSWLHRERKAWPWAFAAVALAVMLTAWFWFPALTEQSTVQLHLSRTTRNNDFHYNFVSWAEMLFTLPSSYDPAFLNPPMRLYVGLGQSVLALVSLLWIAWRERRPEQRWSALFFAGVALFYLWMSSAASVKVWESFSLLAFVQFPWRLVGRALLPLSLVAGAVFAASGDDSEEPLARRPRTWFYYAALVLLVLLSWPDSYPPKGTCLMEPTPDIADVYAFEQSGWMGVDPEGSYFPIWVEQHPRDTTLAEAFERGELPERLDVTAAPADLQLLEADYGALRAELLLDAPHDFQARWLGLYYPGWYVRVDSVLVPTSPEAETGLLTFPVPAGQHRVVVYFAATPQRGVVTAVSLAGVLLLGAAVAWPKLRFGKSETVEPSAYTNTSGPLLLAFAVGLVLLKFLLVDHVSNPVRRDRLASGPLPEVTHTLQQPFSGGVTLLGYDVASDAMPADAELQVDLLWETNETPQTVLRTSVLLLGPDGLTWSPAGTARPRGYEPTPPSTMWQAGQYIYDPHIVQPLPGTPPGTYRLRTSIFDANTLAPASALGADGNPLGPDLDLGALPVTRPLAPPSLARLQVPESATLQPCGDLGLWSMTLDRASAAPGEIVAVRWVWEALADPGEPLTASVTLRSDAGELLRRWDFAPATAWWPTDLWRAGERWVGRHVLRLPGSLESGDYSLELTLPACEARLAAQPLAVAAPQRLWEVPDSLPELDVIFGEQLRLAGGQVEPLDIAAAEELSVTLAWQALAEMETSYRVFVHLVDAQGGVVTQHDGEPAAWTRPTSGWAIDEVVAEVRTLALPSDMAAGDYELRVGVYDLQAGRLRTPDGADFFVITVLQVP